MADIFKRALILFAPPPPPVIPADYNGYEFTWKMFVFRPALFQVEGVLLAVIAFYMLFHFVGRSSNLRRAQKWLDTHMPVYHSQFSLPTTRGLISDGNTDFFNFSTGRRHVETLHTIFTMRPRHDLAQSLFHWFRSWVDIHIRPSDDLQLDFRLDPSAVSYDFVFAIANKHELLWIKDDRWDLNLTRLTETPVLSNQLVLMSEFADIFDALRKLPAFQAIIDILNSPAVFKYFKYLSITDQPRQRPTTPMTAEQKEKHLILALKCPSTSDSAATVQLVTAIFTLIDNLGKLSLRPETKLKLKKTRDALASTLKKEAEKEKEEENGNPAEDKKSAKKRAEEERISKLSAAEQQKVLERERKRSQRKHQGKISVRK